MSSAMIMEAILTKIKTVLSEAEEVLASAVTPEASEEFNRLLGEAMSAGSRRGPADLVGDGRNGRGDHRSGGENPPLQTGQ